jgi:hypothetical protein
MPPLPRTRPAALLALLAVALTVQLSADTGNLIADAPSPGASLAVGVTDVRSCRVSVFSPDGADGATTAGIRCNARGGATPQSLLVPPDAESAAASTAATDQRHTTLVIHF